MRQVGYLQELNNALNEHANLLKCVLEIRRVQITGSKSTEYKQ